MGAVNIDRKEPAILAHLAGQVPKSCLPQVAPAIMYIGLEHEACD
ncbi:hypothetical protein AA0117_g11906 [Alternaria alternata]|uniref:Uncharacterized protein n=2 Tax=Alternaria sect. Alternaria TaxID=2499237 RepID=A0A4Q4N0Q8_ALTAL|nr:hypothetical protein AG0111_0g12128 [Alternaria gaisen]RYN66153.1 hypothetical protein AA0117_g11906 [Alternaria alternata]RYO11287.1 hypothetical protein AA0121_g10070 [Alternaria tenuissima]